MFYILTDTLIHLIFLLLPVLFIYLQKRANSTPPLPGPTQLPIIGNMHQLSQMLHIDFTNMSKKYGPIFQLRLGVQTWIVVNSPEIAKELVVKQDAIYSSRPNIKILSGILFRGGKSIAFAPFGKWLKTTRALAMQGLRPYIIDTKYHPLIKQQIILLLKTLYRKSRRDLPIDPSKDLFISIINLLTIITYGKSSNPEDPLIKKFSEIITKEFSFWSPRVALIDYFPMLEYLPWARKLKDEALNLRGEIEAITDSLLRQVGSSLESNKNQGMTGCFAAQLLRAVKIDLNLFTLPNTHEFTKDENGRYILDYYDVMYLCNVFMFGGTYTTFESQRWIFALLAMHPKVQSRIQEELDRIVGKVRFYDLEDEGKLHYLKATIKECLRYRTVMPLLLPHQTIKDDWGYCIPANTTIIINTHAIHNNCSSFVDPEVFRPERYLDNHGHLKEPNDLQDPWTFGRGHRQCSGIHLAERSLTTMTGYTMTLFTLENEIDPLTGLQRAIDLDGTGHAFSFNVEDFKVRFVPRDGVDIDRLSKSVSISEGLQRLE